MSNAFLVARRKSGGVPAYSAALFMLGAAAIHFAVAPGHLQEYLPFGVFFFGVSLAQATLGIQLVQRPSRRAALLGGLLNVAILAVWAVSRTIGLPFGPTPWTAEEMGLSDIACALLEAVSAALLFVLAARGPRPTRRTHWRVMLGTGPSLLLALALTATGVAAASTEMPDAFEAAPTVAGQASTSVVSLIEAPGEEPVESFTLTAEVSQVNGQDAWTFNGSAPGPELRVTQGDRVRITLVNQLPVATTLHWHGVQVPNAEDGVAGLTQNAVAPGQSFTYEFVARDAGTYWYHSHQDTEQQIGRGLFGALVVEPPAGHVAEDRDYTLVLHDVPGGPKIAVNGVTDDLRLAARPGERVRLRLINAIAPAMDGTPETPVLIGAPYEVVALDGRTLNAPQPLGPERLPLGMGQRADLVFTMPSVGSVRLVDGQTRGQASLLERFFPPSEPTETVTIGDGQLPASMDVQSLPVFDPTTYGAPAPDAVADGPVDATFPIVLDKSPGFRDGRPELIHSINGYASPDVPPITVQQGEVVRLHIVNNSGEYHPMHLHGHVMSVLARNGEPIQGSPLHLDTVLIGPNETWDVAFAADNPGIWMFHCHVLLHAAYGMSMTINYAGITSPFEMGSRSGNIPE